MAEHVTEQSINEAAAGSDVERMESVADRARIAIAKSVHNADVTFEETAHAIHGVAENAVVSMRDALTKLEGRIAELRAADTPARPQPAPRVDPDAPKTTTS